MDQLLEGGRRHSSGATAKARGRREGAVMSFYLCIHGMNPHVSGAFLAGQF